MDERQIDEIHDRIEQEIFSGHFVTEPGHKVLFGNLAYWREEVGHPSSGHGYCRTCGPAASCLLLVFVDAVIETAVRRALDLGSQAAAR